MLSKKEEYALRAILELAFRNNYGFVKVKSIAFRQKIPFRFLEGILNQLKNAGLVESTRGQNGGYRLIKSPDTITVLDVINAITKNDFVPQKENNKEKTFKLRWDYTISNFEDRIRKNIKRVLINTTIAELIEMEKSFVGTYVMDYSI